MARRTGATCANKLTTGNPLGFLLSVFQMKSAIGNLQSAIPGPPSSIFHLRLHLPSRCRVRRRLSEWPIPRTSFLIPFQVVNTKTISIAGTCLVPIDPALLKQCPLGEDVDVSAERDALVIRAVRRRPRQGWAEALAAVPEHDLERDQTDLIAFRETPHDWDRKDWDW
jgi:hypothetical protein